MIKQIEIKNFQSHKYTIIDLSKGINIFVGTSNHGKSAIIRALLWVITNRPVGTGYVSHWNWKKDSLIEETSVFVELYSGITVMRKRTDYFNGYIINGKTELSSIGMDVPEEIQQIFNVSVINIQQQFDSPFLLSDSAGEVARFLNNTIKLDAIDSALKKAEQLKRKNKFDLSYLNECICYNKSQLEKLDWIDIIDALIKKVKKIQDRIDKQNANKIIICDLIKKYTLLKNKYIDIKFDNINSNIKYIEWIENSLLDKKKKLSSLSVLISSHIKKNKLQNKINNIQLSKDIFSEIEIISSGIIEKYNKAQLIINVIKEYEEIIIENKKIEMDIIILKKQFPDICPLCGSKL